MTKIKPNKQQKKSLEKLTYFNTNSTKLLIEPPTSLRKRMHSRLCEACFVLSEETILLKPYTNASATLERLSSGQYIVQFNCVHRVTRLTMHVTASSVDCWSPISTPTLP